MTVIASEGNTTKTAATNTKPVAQRQPVSPNMRIGPRYCPIKQVGSGARGVVWSAKDLQLSESVRRPRGDVAVKKIANAFEHTTDTKRMMREILLLLVLDHPNILTIKDVMCPRDGNGGWASLYIVTDLMDTDLHRIIQSPQPLSEDHIQYFVYQLLRAVKYLHSAGILHRDIKPANVLVNENCELKLCDFGLARCIPDANTAVDEEDSSFMTSYVVTRWYRAPELLLQEKFYNGAIDIWSVGCVLGELLGRKALFPGTDYVDEIIRVTNVIGTPVAEDLAAIGSEQARQFMLTLEPKAPIPFEDLFPKANPVVVDLLSRMLLFNPNRRLTIDEALDHPFFAPLHDPADVPVAAARFYFPSDAQLTKHQMKEIVFQQVLKFHPEQEADLIEMKKSLAAVAR
eukprot:TRINITY_DN1116_c0_g1_i1.p1 TRINITY_DN1116_c0_g1~~TRINITY_DN1116_c0_g1_i1.p1  ORF type:complete len:415 (-),score=72.50 TRINITY_DN1116_c0_g1_i1:426-1628(-)